MVASTVKIASTHHRLVPFRLFSPGITDACTTNDLVGRGLAWIHSASCCLIRIQEGAQCLNVQRASTLYSFTLSPSEGSNIRRAGVRL